MNELRTGFFWILARWGVLIVSLMGCRVNPPVPLDARYIDMKLEHAVCQTGQPPAIACFSYFTADLLPCADCGPSYRGCLLESAMVWCANSCADPACHYEAPAPLPKEVP